MPPPCFHPTLVETPGQAVALWLRSTALVLGRQGNGLIFCPSLAACEPYLRAAITMMPRNAWTLPVSGGGGLSLDSGPRLDVIPVACDEDLQQIPVRPFGDRSVGTVVIHDPQGWPSVRMPLHLATMFGGSRGHAVHVIAVGSPFPYVLPDVSPDYDAVATVVAEDVT